MRQYIILIFLFCTAIIFSQNSNSITGKLTDKEYNNEPLAFGTVSIKGSILETSTDLYGFYKFENLKPGEYVLKFSFVGYETQEKKVLISGEKEIKVNIKMLARTPSFEKVVTTSTSNQEKQLELTSS